MSKKGHHLAARARIAAHIQLAEALRKGSDPRGAIHELRQAVQVCNADGHSAAIAFFPRVAEVYRNMGEYNSAEEVLRRHIQLLGIWGGKPGDKLARSQLELSKVIFITGHRRRRRLKEAESLARSALSLFEKSGGINSPRAAAALEHIVTCLRYMRPFLNDIAAWRWVRRWQVSKLLKVEEDLLKRELAIRERKYGRVHVAVELPLFRLGMLERERGRFAQSREYLQRVLEVTVADKGRTRDQLLVTVRNVAHTYRDEGNIKAYEQSLLDGLKVMEGYFGETAKELMGILLELWSFYLNRDNRSEARKFEMRYNQVDV